MSRKLAVSLFLVMLGLASWGAALEHEAPVAGGGATAMDGTGFPL